jgi:tetratricopeptide (TPR) repeat protein
MPTNAALHQLRPPIADFVGRQEEIARLTAVLCQAQTGEGRIAAICGVRGMGGIGKTTLAEYVAHQLRPLFPDAQLVIDLRGASTEPLTPAQALQQLMRAFMPEEKLPEELPALQTRYRSLLNGRRALILADDARDAIQVRPLLPPTGCALLVTSRQRFALDGMATLDLARLSDAEAIRLLQSIYPRLIDDQAKRLAHLCGCLPLALRVSAGILLNDEALPVERYLTQLADERRRLAQLRDPDDPERDVAATLGMSYATLDPSTQTAFRRLGVLAADADLKLIAAELEQSTEEAEGVLRLLLRRSLVEYDPVRERWGLHDLVRVFALEQLAEAGEEHAVRLRYAEQVIRVIQAADQHYHGGGDGNLEGLGQFDREHAHLEAVRAWLWAQPPTPTTDALLIAEAHATQHIGQFRDPLRGVQVLHHERATAAAQRQGNQHAQGRFLGNLGNAYFFLGEIPFAITLYTQWLSIAQEVGDRSQEGQALGGLGNAYGMLGETLRAIGYLEQWQTIAQEVGDRCGEGRALGNLGYTYLKLGEARTAIGYLKRDLVIAQEVGDRWGEGMALDNLGSAYYLLGNFVEALACNEAAYRLAQETRNRWLEGMTLHNLANTQAVFEQYMEADIN